MKKILLIEDDNGIQTTIKYYLQTEGFIVETASKVKEGLEKVNNNPYNIILLDINLPDGTGYDFYKKVKEEKNIPVIFLTALDEEKDIVKGFELGADDYITKPFSIRELIARVKANLRKVEVNTNPRSTENEYMVAKKKDNRIVVNDLSLDLDKFEVKVRGEIIDLTVREFEVIKFLAMQPGQVVTRETLLEKVWGYEYYGDIRTVDVTVRRIREKIEKDTSTPKILITKRGVGYYIASK